jgi:tetratricopeptide (TPR) repeat protein
MFSLHRLVQAVLRESMATDEEEAWKARVILAVILARPNVEDVAQWDTCQRWLPHALVCTAAIKQKRDSLAKTGSNVVFSTDASLLSIDGSFFDTVGYYLHRRGRYAEAEPLLKQTLAITEQELGPTHLDTTRNLNILGSLYQDQGRFSEAEPLLKQALAITEQELGPTHYGTAESLNNLAILYSAQRKYKEAEPLYRRTLTIIESILGPADPNTAAILSSLAILYQNQRKYAEAEPLLKRALAIAEQTLGPTDPGTAAGLINLATFYQKQKKYAEHACPRNSYG